jgi:hypothetical protein
VSKPFRISSTSSSEKYSKDRQSPPWEGEELVSNDKSIGSEEAPKLFEK